MPGGVAGERPVKAAPYADEREHKRRYAQPPSVYGIPAKPSGMPYVTELVCVRLPVS